MNNTSMAFAGNHCRIADVSTPRRRSRVQFFRVTQDIPELGIRANMSVIANFDVPPVSEEYVLAKFTDGWTLGECKERAGRMFLAIGEALLDLAGADQVAAVEGHGWFRGMH